MKRTKKVLSRILLSSLIILILCLFSYSFSYGVDEGESVYLDTVRFDIPNGEVPGPPAIAQMKIGVIFVSHIPLQAFWVHFFWTGPMSLDSVVFSPFINNYTGERTVEINNDDKNVYIFFMVTGPPLIPSGTYHMSYLHFAPQDTGAIVLDTTRLSFIDPLGDWSPFFIRGEYIVLEATNMSGDANESGEVDVVDVVFLIDYLFRAGPPPDPLYICDVNTDCIVSISDIVYLINYV